MGDNMKKIITAVALVATALFGGVIVAAPTEAAPQRHTASGGADCTSFHVDAVSYNAGQDNVYSWSFGSQSDSGTFPDQLHVDIATPQGGATTAWSYDVKAEDGSYHFSDSGTVGPCGTPPVVPPKDRHARTHVKIIDECNCYRDHVRMFGKHVTIKKFHPTRLTWRFKVTGDTRSDGAVYLLPNHIGGSHGWSQVQWYKVRTTNQVCPCKVRGDCHQVHPHYQPPHTPCRGKCH